MTRPIIEIDLKNAVVLQRNRIITSAGDGYGITYFSSPEMKENHALCNETLEKFWREFERRKKLEEFHL